MVDEALDGDQVGYFGGHVSLEVNSVTPYSAPDPVGVCLLFSIVRNDAHICWGFVVWDVLSSNERARVCALDRVGWVTATMVALK